MAIGYTELGIDFFEDEASFEDTFTPCLNEMFNTFEAVRLQLKHDAHCASVKDMITVVN